MLRSTYAFCVDIRSVLIPIITFTAPTTPTHAPWYNTLLFIIFWPFFPVRMSCSALHDIKAGFWQSYHWPTAVITKGLHSCL